MKRLLGRPFALIGVNVGGLSAEQLARVMAEEKLPWRSFADRGAIRKQWCNPGTPTLYLIDRAGVIRRKWLGTSDEAVMDAAVEELVREAERGGK